MCAKLKFNRFFELSRRLVGFFRGYRAMEVVFREKYHVPVKGKLCIKTYARFELSTLRSTLPVILRKRFVL